MYGGKHFCTEWIKQQIINEIWVTISFVLKEEMES